MQIAKDWPNDKAGWHKEKGRNNRKWSMRAKSGEPARLVAELSSPEFCARMAALLGEKELFSDQEQFGGGLHAIPNKGFLNMHCDFRYHPRGFRRVANLLLYVNLEWQEEWGGALVLKGDGEARYLPEPARAVIFRTADNWHGHPERLRVPEGVMRRSIAVYYYSRELGTHDSTRYMR